MVSPIAMSKNSILNIMRMNDNHMTYHKETTKINIIYRTEIEGWSLIEGLFPHRGPIPYRGKWFCVRYPVWSHTFASPSANSRGAVVSYWRKYVHKVIFDQ